MMQLSNNTKKITLCSIFTVFALMLSYVEVIIPQFIPLPGFKIGLANIAVMLFFFYISKTYAAVLSLVRILLSAVLFGSVTSFWFSIFGGLASFLALLSIYYIFNNKIGFVGIGIMCAVFHTFGQIIVASFLFGISIIFTYLPILMIISIVTGSITGLFFYLINKYILNSKYKFEY